MSLFASAIDNAKAIGAVVACCTGIGSGYVLMDGPVPASRGYVIQETRNLKGDVIDSRLETNDVRRQLLRKEKFDRTLDLEKEQASNVRAILRERLDWIENELESVNKARDELRKERAAK